MAVLFADLTLVPVGVSVRASDLTCLGLVCPERLSPFPRNFHAQKVRKDFSNVLLWSLHPSDFSYYER